MRPLLRQARVQIAAILVLALFIRLLGLASRPIWYDEAFSVLFAEKGTAAMLQGTLAPSGGGAAEEHPLGYYFLLHGWMGLFDNSLPAVRAFSILAGTGTVGVIYLTGLELLNKKTGLVAALFASLAPFQIHYSQEIRMYALLGFWLLLATYAFLKGRKSHNWKWWGIFAVGAVAAQYTHTLASLYLIPLALTPLLQRDWRTLRSLLISGFGALVLYLPWLIHIPAQLAKVDSAYWISPPGVEKLFTLLLVYVTNLPLPDEFLMPALVISLFVFFIALWQSARMLTGRAPGWKTGLWLLYLAFAPPLLSFVISQWRPVYLERSFLPSGAIFCLWAAWAFTETRLPRPVQIIVIGALAAAAGMGIRQHLSYSGFPYAPYQTLQASLEDQFQPGDAILHSSKLSLLPAVYFDPSLDQRFIADPPGSAVDTLASATQEVLGVVSSPSIQEATHASHRVWFVIFQQSIDEYIAIGAQTHPQLAWLEQEFSMESVQQLGDLKLYLFTR